jgi:transposase
LCGAEKSSGATVQRTPLSKQGNKHLQTTLIEAAKMAPRNSPELAMLYDKEKQKGNANRVIVESGIFKWQKQVAASLRRTWQRTRRISSVRGLPGLAVNATGRRSESF